MTLSKPLSTDSPKPKWIREDLFFYASCLRVYSRNTAVWTLLLFWKLHNLKGQQNFWCPICRRKAATKRSRDSFHEPNFKSCINPATEAVRNALFSFKEDCQGKTGLSSNRTAWVSWNIRSNVSGFSGFIRCTGNETENCNAGNWLTLNMEGPRCTKGKRYQSIGITSPSRGENKSLKPPPRSSKKMFWFHND